MAQAGAVLLVETIRRTGLDQAKSVALRPWRKSRAVHDPGKVLPDVALAVALGGDCLADVAMLRAKPAVFGPVATDPTVSRLVGTLAVGGTQALTALRAARADVREHVWKLAGDAAPDAGGQMVVDLDGVLVLTHSEKQDAAATCIRAARATGLCNLSLYGTAQNRVWLEIVQIALDLLVWMPVLTLSGPAAWPSAVSLSGKHSSATKGLGLGSRAKSRHRGSHASDHRANSSS